MTATVFAYSTERQFRQRQVELNGETVKSETQQRLIDLKKRLRGDQDDSWGACCVENSYCDMWDWGWSPGEMEKGCIENNGQWYPFERCEEIACITFGSCCFTNGKCTDKASNESECYEMGGFDFSAGSSCAEYECYTTPYISCCIPGNDSCIQMDLYSCYQIGGVDNQYYECDQYCASYHAPCEEITMFARTALNLSATGCDIYFVSNNTNEGQADIASYLGQPSWGHGLTYDGYEYSIRSTASIELGLESYWFDEVQFNTPQNKLIAVANTEYGNINAISCLDLNNIDFSNVIPNDGYDGWTSISFITLFDVTADGRPDAIFRIERNGNLWNGENPNGRWICFVENISESGDLVCKSDLDGDQVVEIDDLIQVISDWGPCK